MTGELARDEAFRKLVAALDASGVLPHVMIVGSWAEWLYPGYFSAACPQGQGGAQLRVDIGKTHDIDVYFRDYLLEIGGAERLRMPASSRVLTSRARSSSEGSRSSSWPARPAPAPA